MLIVVLFFHGRASPHPQSQSDPTDPQHLQPSNPLHTHTPLSNMHTLNLLLLCLCLLLRLLFLAYQSYSGWAWQGHDCCWGVEVIEFLSQSYSRQHRQFRHSQARRNRQGWASPWLRTTINDRGTDARRTQEETGGGREERKKENEMNVMQHPPPWRLFPTFFSPSIFVSCARCAVPSRGVSGQLLVATLTKTGGELINFSSSILCNTDTWFKTSVGPFNSVTRLYAAHAVPCHIYFVAGTFNWCFTLQLPRKKNSPSLPELL